jgi:hypothetical protein
MMSFVWDFTSCGQGETTLSGVAQAAKLLLIAKKNNNKKLPTVVTQSIKHVKLSSSHKDVSCLAT